VREKHPGPIIPIKTHPWDIDTECDDTQKQKRKGYTVLLQVSHDPIMKIWGKTSDASQSSIKTIIRI
jgi:hypothetical protein